MASAPEVHVKTARRLSHRAT